jgi:hypothetical protein
MQQTSHQTLSSTLGLGLALLFSTFAVFMIPRGFVGAGPLLKARNGGSRVVRLMFAVIERTGQHKFPCRRGLPSSVRVVQRKQYGQLALGAPNAEIPSLVGFGPGKVHNAVVCFDSAFAPEPLDFMAFRSSRIRVLLCILAFR